jgi:hypothetical protein
MHFSTVVALLLPAAAMAFPQANGKRWSNNTVPTTTRSHTSSPIPLPTAPPSQICTPGKYQCTYSATAGWGWAVCDTTSQWVNGGSCDSSETCIFNALNGSPYCVPSPASPNHPTPQPPSGNHGNHGNHSQPATECQPERYQCAHSDANGWYINQCDASGHWEAVVTCKATETCTYGAVKGYPYCTPKTDSTVCTPGTYQCKYFNDASKWGWQVCSAEGKWLDGGYCNSSETCSFNPLNASPYCV